MDNRIGPAAAEEKLAVGCNLLPLVLDKLSYEIGGTRLIKEISASFDAGSLTVLMGPNGAGKSLLLRLCHGLIAPSSGAIRWDGTKPRNPEHYQAMVFQRPTMLRRSVTANLHHVLKQRRIARAQRLEIIDDMLRRTGLARLAKAPARSLSVGEQQRLAVARAWSVKPEVLFMDEPTAALDPAATHALEDIIAAIRDSGTKIIMSTHDLGQARRLADDVAFLYRGRLLERADAKSFFDKPENDLAEAFLNGELLWWNRKEMKPPENFKVRWQK
ncbi:MAG: phosphate ABC transporter ATP-binding protein [Rhodospirillales bacterium]|jgi:tungstate transport system ATP-binding protein|nr:ABC transporter ATP-binding protein [Rhodospirillaceae bacterium]MDP6428154.1 phosphate ABC transporter ATP-binding protein [Rhodospirillales bacterium]MDP6642963.1 phosphate ABC transporter ATP-binding protein [Rhodospirillales bacterium]MDP6840718.1 phosphate ABC transporter ATP-binding protein [Rhodospirillales bacterium]